MSKIAILTDSSAYLPVEIKERYPIHIIPLKILWGDKSYLDGVTITPKEFYPELERCSALPTTSQLSHNEFLEAFDQLAQSYDGIIVPLISSGISGTVESARKASAEYQNVPVVVIDSLTTASGLALLTMSIGRAIEEGHTLPEVAKIAQDIIRRQKIFFAVDTLKYLHKGGRIGGASRYMGTMLGIKPILYMNPEGRIDALERVRTKQKAFQRLIELAEEAAGQSVVRVGLLHANAFAEAAELQEQLVKRLHVEEIHAFELSPVIATHVGPGTLGVAVQPV